MSRIFNPDLFDSERFERIENPTDTQLDECIAYRGLDDLDESVQEDIKIEIILESKSCGFIDAMLSDLEEPVSKEYETDRHLLIDLLAKISEDNGRLVEKFGQTDPFFYGYLKLKEIKDLIRILTNLPDELDEGWLNEFKDALLIICEKAVQKNLGLVYWALP